MKTSRQIVDAKEHGLWFVHPDDTVFDAINMMAEKGIGSILVMKDEKLVGILSERGCTQKIILEDKSPKKTPVKEIMTTNVLCATADQTGEECMALMAEKRIRHLPVVDGDQVVGVVSMRDLVENTIAEQGIAIKELERFVEGPYVEGDNIH